MKKAALRRWALPLVGLLGTGCSIDERSPGVQTDTGVGMLGGTTDQMPSAAGNASPAGPPSSAGAGGADATGNMSRGGGDSSNTPSLAAAGSAAATPGGQSPGEPATPAGVCADGQLIDFDTVYEAVAADLGAAASADAPFFRYLTLSNRFDSTGCSGTALDVDRRALTKLVNMLSLGSTATAPVAIDTERTMYRLDERNYQWNRSITVNGQTFADLWEAAVAANPFAVEFSGSSADPAKAAAGTTVPVMLADSFLDTVATGDLYYASIGVTRGDAIDTFISTGLGVDAAGNLANGTQVRAGTTKSSVQRQDVVVQGDAVRVGQGRLWQAFNIDPAQSIFETPLGLETGGREAIFTLPNGMMAFLIADATGAIAIDSEVLLDTQQANLRAIASISCSSCHSRGLIPVVDEVSSVSLANAETLGLNDDQVQRLQDVYRTPAEFAQVMATDSLSYQTALGQLQLSTMDADPVAAAFVQFDKDLALSDAAGDFGMTPMELSANLNVLEPTLAVLGTSVLDRDDFARFYVDSLCILSLALDNQPAAAQCDAAARAAAAP